MKRLVVSLCALGLAFQLQASCFLKEDSAAELQFGPFLDDGDLITTEESLTISQADVRVKKGEAAFAQKNESSSCAHLENGIYECVFDATDTDTSGDLLLAITESGATPQQKRCKVMPGQSWDSLFSTDKLQVEAVEYDSALDFNATQTATINAVLDTVQATYAAVKPEVAGRQLAIDSAGGFSRLYWYLVGWSEGWVSDAGGSTTTLVDSALSSYADDYWNGMWVVSVWVSANFGHPRRVDDFESSTGTLTVSPPWSVSMPAGEKYGFLRVAPEPELRPEAFGDDVAQELNLVVHSGMAQAAGSGQITLAAGASSVDNLYKWGEILTTGGTGAGQKRYILNYDGTTKIALVAPGWVVTPDATTEYEISPGVGR